METRSSQIKSTIKELGACTQAGDYKAVTPAKVVKEIHYWLNESVEYGWTDEKEQKEKRAELAQNLELLKTALRGEKLFMCQYSSVPAYSDGNEDFFVRNESGHVLHFTVGFPD